MLWKSSAAPIALAVATLLAGVVGCHGALPEEPSADAGPGPDDSAVRDAAAADGGPASDAMTADGAPDAKDPRALGPIELWFDGDLGVATSAGQVSSWQDQSTHHRDLVRGNPGIPSIQVAAFPGSSHGALRFAPESTSNGGHLVRTGFTLPQPLTVAVAIYPTDTSDAHYDIPLGGTMVPTLGIGRLGDGFQMVAGSGPTFTNIRVLGSWTAASHVVIATYNGTQSSLRVDDLPVQAATLSGAPLEGLAVGQSGPTFTGYIGEILIYGSALAPTQQASLGAYLRARFPR